MFCFVRFYLPPSFRLPFRADGTDCCRPQKSSGPANPPGRKTAETMIRMAKYTIPKQMPQRNRRFPAMFLPFFRRKSLMPDRSPQCPLHPAFLPGKFPEQERQQQEEALRSDRKREEPQPAGSRCPAPTAHVFFFSFQKKSPPIL